jgi:hypothetical protein
MQRLTIIIALVGSFVFLLACENFDTDQRAWNSDVCFGRSLVGLHPQDCEAQP